MVHRQCRCGLGSGTIKRIELDHNHYPTPQDQQVAKPASGLISKVSATPFDDRHHSLNPGWRIKKGGCSPPSVCKNA